MENILDPLVQQVIMESSAIQSEAQNSNSTLENEHADETGEVSEALSCIGSISDSSDEVNNDDSDFNGDTGGEAEDSDSDIGTPGDVDAVGEEEEAATSSSVSVAPRVTNRPNFSVAWPLSPMSGGIPVNRRYSGASHHESDIEALIKEYDFVHESFIQTLRATLGISSETESIKGEEESVPLAEAVRFATAEESNGAHTELDSPIRTKRRKSVPLHFSPPESPEDVEILAVLDTSTSTTKSQPAARKKKENAMLNHIVLTEIFKCLPAKDLKSFRLVSRRWDEIATSSLLARRLCKIVLTQSVSVISLNTCIETALKASRKFPANTLELSLDLSLSRSEFIKFFKMQGPHINEVSVGADDRSKKPMSMFRNLLTKQLPKLEHIVMRPFFVRAPTNDSSLPNSWRLFPVQENVPAVTLPLIKTLRFDPWEYTVMLQDLLAASVNLEELKHFKVANMEAVSKAGKIGAVKEFQFPFDDKYVSPVSKFAEASPKLVYLDLFRFKGSVSLSVHHAVYLTMILNSSADTLKRIRLPCISFLEEVTFPVLPYLAELCVYDLCDRLVDGYNVEILKPVFSPWMSVKHYFPNVNKITMEFKRFTKETVNKYFPTTDYDGNEELSGIHCLELTGKFDRTGLDLLAKKFPNVKKIIIRNAGDYYVDNQDLWYFPWAHLKSLELHGLGLRLRKSCSCALHLLALNAGQPCSLNSFFTGIPQSICRNLNAVEDHSSLVNPCCLQVIQVNSSIHNLQGLTRLKIFLDNPRSFKDENMDTKNRDISHVFKLYALDGMPKLERVTFVYDHNGKNSIEIAASLRPLLTSSDLIKLSHESFSDAEESDFIASCNGARANHGDQFESNSESVSSSDEGSFIELD